jgi:FkbM family methyltransferase
MVLSRVRYYLTLIPVSLRTIKNRAAMLALLFGLPMLRPALLRFRDGTQFRVRTAMDVWIIIEIYVGRAYEQDLFEIQNDWLVIDIGAGLGEFSVTAAKKCPDGVVYAYEPFRESFELMRENILLNKAVNVIAYPCGVGGDVGPLRLNTASGVPVSYSTAVNDNDTGRHETIVRGTTLDEIFKALRIEKCDLIKLDCEGAEYDILFHASSPTFQKIKRISLEYHDGVTKFTHPDLVRFLESNGFSVILKPSPVHRHTGLLFASKSNCDTVRPTLRPSRTA